MGVNAAIDAAAIEVLFEKVNALETRVAELEAKQPPEIDYGAPHNTNEECHAHTCSYYDFYLAQGAADLSHEGYHSAERQCERAQKALEAWLIEDEHDERNRQIPPHLIRECDRWERAVRA